MRCSKVKRLLSSYVDGELKEGLRLKVEEHLSSCSGCAQELKDLQALVREISEVRGVSLPLGFSTSLHQKLLVASEKGLGSPLLIFRLRPIFTASLLLVVGVSLLAAGLFYQWRLPSTPTTISHQSSDRRDILVPHQSTKASDRRDILVPHHPGVVSATLPRSRGDKYFARQRVTQQRDRLPLKAKETRSEVLQPSSESSSSSLPRGEVVLRLSLKSKEDLKGVKVEVRLSQGACFAEGESATWEEDLKKDIPLSLLIPLNLSSGGGEAKVKVCFDNQELVREIKLSLPEQAQSLPEDSSDDNPQSGFVLSFVSLDKSIDNIRDRFPSKVEFEGEGDLSIFLDSGLVYLAPLTFKRACLMPNPEGKVSLCYAQGKSSDITDFQMVTANQN